MCFIISAGDFHRNKATVYKVVGAQGLRQRKVCASVRFAPAFCALVSNKYCGRMPSAPTGTKKGLLYNTVAYQVENWTYNRPLAKIKIQSI